MKLVLKTVLTIAFICGIPATQAATSDGKIWGFCGLVTCSGLLLHKPTIKGLSTI